METVLFPCNVCELIAFPCAIWWHENVRADRQGSHSGIAVDVFGGRTWAIRIWIGGGVFAPWNSTVARIEFLRSSKKTYLPPMG